MKQTIAPPRITGEDVAFTVDVDYRKHECVITKEALQQLSASKNKSNPDIDTMEVFRALEGAISGVARRLIAAGVPGTPLVLTSSTFSGPTRRL